MLLELIPELRSLLAREPEFALSVIKEASPEQSTPEGHQTTLERLQSSVAEGRELVSWLRCVTGILV